MSRGRSGWKRQSWQDAESEIGQALEPSVQPGDELRQIADEQIDDSPYQARAEYEDAQIAALAQGMTESGFQGVLFVRSLPGGADGSRERFQLVYGHRRRRAWRAVCAGQGTPCVLPVVVRPFTDQQMLTIGAQENLQREDLNPMEEARLVVWHQEIYYPAGLGEIGRMLGKSEDWAKTRSRLGQLPEALQAVVWRSPGLMTGVLEISRLWDSTPDKAEEIVERAEREGLNLRQIRQLVGKTAELPINREKKLNRRVDTPIVTNSTISAEVCEENNEQRIDPPIAMNGTDSSGNQKQRRVGFNAQIEAEAKRILAQLQGWQQRASDEAAQEAIERNCKRILHQLQEIIDQIANVKITDSR